MSTRYCYRSAEVKYENAEFWVCISTDRKEFFELDEIQLVGDERETVLTSLLDEEVRNTLTRKAIAIIKAEIKATDEDAEFQRKRQEVLDRIARWAA